MALTSIASIIGTLEMCWKIHELLIWFWFYHCIEIVAICYSWTHMNMNAKTDHAHTYSHVMLLVTGHFGWDPPQVDAREDRDRDRDFHLQLLTSSFQVVVIILFWFSLINIHPHTFCVRESNTQWKMISTKRLLLQKGQNMFLFFD